MRNQLFSLLTSRLLWGFIGITALASVIWMLGPLVTVNDLRPLEAPLHRQVLVGISYFLWILFQLIPHLYSAWFNSKLLHNLQYSNVDHGEMMATEELLTSRFNEAASLLKKAHFYQRPPSSWFQRYSARYLYQLPWYMIVGAPGAGKTTALINSGLEFPLTDSMGKQAIRGVGGTRHCDWWFTDRAVLLDTAGRYTLQESMRARDASEWQTFINLLKHYRARQPINGVIITISVADLLSDSAEARFTQATALRNRMAELHQQTGIHFPVYVMVTKTDLLKGFMSYFATLDKSQREQTWGFTFPWEPNRDSERALNQLFDQQFLTLSNRLTRDLACKMAQEHDLTQRADCFLFPQEFASLRPLLAEYLDIVFSPDAGEVAWSARGLFFTSGTQEGLPFDRVMGELTRKLQLPQARRHSIASWDSVNRAAPIPANKGQSFFIRDLLSEVIFKESGLAGSDRSWEYRNRLMHWVGYGALALSLLVASGWWLLSYYQNQHYLQQIEARVPALSQQAEHFSQAETGDIIDLLPFLNNLVKLPQPGEFSLDSPPLSIRAGLYRGDQISDAAWTLYQNALRSLLLPRVARQITATLRNDKGGDSEFSRNALRAYQMLYQPRNYDGEFLRGWVMQNFQRTLPADVTTRDLQQLDWHLSQLLDRQIQTSPYARDNALMMRKLADNLDKAGQNGTALALTPGVLFPSVTRNAH
ncbi:type VI secretion system membrane subunit TssM [Erwiniaceae bacterium BAC15a-03b]|uniref:Type VI secretion system membrane subunit TssM n=1 Tax=Winslowiella arboricola TaxID=2978220 RepID=A0A9J6PRA7_9GAMM|nr:type VI secretion system membrane subunit TssM [Winslowiella arboricola]MCU5774870.1 type VI secretion system membrane subunit TssM [Winslowiella arboricola]MCU5779978.1 type VI secretion system membrane subunit TssM [Winslowiella arboricola]